MKIYTHGNGAGTDLGADEPITSIMLVGSSNAVLVVGINNKIHGSGSGKDSQKIELGAGEYITKIEGRSGEWVEMLSIYTNKGKNIKVGSKGAPHFSYNFTETEKVTLTVRVGQVGGFRKETGITHIRIEVPVPQAPAPAPAEASKPRDPSKQLIRVGITDGVTVEEGANVIISNTEATGACIDIGGMDEAEQDLVFKHMNPIITADQEVLAHKDLKVQRNATFDASGAKAVGVAVKKSGLPALGKDAEKLKAKIIGILNDHFTHTADETRAKAFEILGKLTGDTPMANRKPLEKEWQKLFCELLCKSITLLLDKNFPDEADETRAKALIVISRLTPGISDVERGALQPEWEQLLSDLSSLAPLSVDEEALRKKVKSLVATKSPDEADDMYSYAVGLLAQFTPATPPARRAELHAELVGVVEGWE